MALKELVKKDPLGLVARAYAFAELAHGPQKRRSGEPYFNHAKATAETLAEWKMDDATVAAGLLHDTVEDTGAPLETVRKDFGEDVAFLVDGVTKLGHLKYRGAKEKAENLRKMVLALSQDLRVIFIKLADRLHNMRTLAALPPEKQKRVALETDEIYASLAYRLGMHHLSGELQDLAFPYLHPDEYRWLLAETRERYGERLDYLKKVKPLLARALAARGIHPVAIDIRAKRYASLYKKLLRRGMDIEKVHDLAAMRVIVNSVAGCYAALGAVHEAWPPVPGRIKDYIAVPKPNGYRSLHTTVLGPGHKTVEIQIKTQEMAEENEHGVAAHWLYDRRRSGEPVAYRGRRLAKELAWVQQLAAWQEKFAEREEHPEEFLEAMKKNFFADRIFAVTPRGDAIDLPLGATPIDFAYHIHTDVGNSAVGAKVNGAIATLDHKLKSGDVVEILVQKGKKPSDGWLRFVATSIARDHIKAALKKKTLFARMTGAAAKKVRRG